MQQRATIVTDLGFGDAGKGSIVDFLAQTDQATLVVRHNGGAQAGHNVVTPTGEHHTFSQFGAGSLVPGVRTHLSRFMLVDPLRLHQEAEALAALGHPDIVRRLTLDEDAIVIAPYQQVANRLRELARGEQRHGSCGYGIGEAMADSINYPELTLRAADLHRPSRMRRRLEAIRQLKRDQLASLRAHIPPTTLAKTEWVRLDDARGVEATVAFFRAMADRLAIVPGSHLAQLLASTPHAVFEGAQGVLLDEWYGFHPYTTWSTTTHANALTLLREANYQGDIQRLGLLRAYATRHGAGPFVTEDQALYSRLIDRYNPANPWQHQFRVGYFDAVMARYALDVVGGVDSLAISCLDGLIGQTDWQLATRYRLDDSWAKPVNAFGQERIAERLAVSPAPDLEYQAELTRGLFNCHPQYQTAVAGQFGSTDIPDYIGIIQQHLDYPVELISTGPTALDKVKI